MDDPWGLPSRSAVVLPGIEEVQTYRNVRQSLSLALALLGLSESFTFSAFHPRDSARRRARDAVSARPSVADLTVSLCLAAFQVETAEDGSRSWEMSLQHALIHVVRKK